MLLTAPKVTIGMPIYNGECTIRRSLDAVLAQTFGDFELIISDNASTDATEEVCREYADKDARVIYVRQAANIGATRNFKYVLDHARGEFFMWWAADDTRSADFVDQNLKFLEANVEYVASTSPNCMEGSHGDGEFRVTFSLAGNIEERFQSFFDNCWNSHGIFYSLIRTQSLRACPEVGLDYYGADWSIDLFLAASGKVSRLDNGLAVFGVNGVSRKPNVWADYRRRPVHWVMPFYEFSLFAYRLTLGFTPPAKMRLVARLFKLNIVSAIFQLHAEARDLINLTKNRWSEFVARRICRRWIK